MRATHVMSYQSHRKQVDNVLSGPAELSEKGKGQGYYTVCDGYSKLEELNKTRKGKVQ